MVPILRMHMHHLFIHKAQLLFVSEPSNIPVECIFALQEEKAVVYCSSTAPAVRKSSWALDLRLLAVYVVAP